MTTNRCFSRTMHLLNASCVQRETPRKYQHPKDQAALGRSAINAIKASRWKSTCIIWNWHQFVVVYVSNYFLSLNRVYYIFFFLDEKTFSIDHLTKLADYYNRLFPKNSPLLQEIYKNLLDKHVLWGSMYICVDILLLMSLTLFCFSEYPIQAMKYGLLAFHRVEKHIPRLYVPNLIAKFNFMSIILDMKNFDKIKEVKHEE